MRAAAAGIVRRTVFAGLAALAACAGGGCLNAFDAKSKDAGKQEQAAAPPAAKQPDAAPAAAKDPDNIIGKKTKELLDKEKAMAENPDLVVHEVHTLGNDPLTQYGNANVKAATFLGTIPLKQQVQIVQATEGRNPTYAEMVTWMKQYNVELPAMRPYYHYAYDAKTAAVLVLEDKALKAQIYKEKGIPLE